MCQLCFHFYICDLCVKCIFYFIYLLLFLFGSFACGVCFLWYHLTIGGERGAGVDGVVCIGVYHWCVCCVVYVSVYLCLFVWIWACG